MKRILMVLVAGFLIFGLFGCEAFDRGMRDVRSSISGLNRTATVYSADGTELKTYTGTFDIETNEYGNKVKFDVNGKRVLIYNAIVIVEEN